MCFLGRKRSLRIWRLQAFFVVVQQFLQSNPSPIFHWGKKPLSSLFFLVMLYVQKCGLRPDCTFLHPSPIPQPDCCVSESDLVSRSFITAAFGAWFLAFPDLVLHPHKSKPPWQLCRKVRFPPPTIQDQVPSYKSGP